jgi:NAD(P)-dependent dehydrogenase (short-subunit alcohol dehydrogenase family)
MAATFNDVTTKTVRRWFITGASSGLGRRLTEHALAQGDHVVAVARRPEALEDLVTTNRRALVTERLDVTNSRDVEAVIGRVLARKPVDVVVNNAGSTLAGATEEMTEQQVREQVETLLVAPMRITRLFLRPLREQGGGRIIQISSYGGQISYPISSAYHAAKWGLEGFTEGVAQEVAEFGIRFTIVEPGATRTGFSTAIQYTKATSAYSGDSAVGRMRRFLKSADETVYTGDPAKLAAVIYATTRQSDPPLRLPLGADSFDLITNALTQRLAALEPLKDLAASVAFQA